MRIEHWKDINGFVNKYQISTKGRVRSVGRYFVKVDGRGHTVRGRILKKSIGWDGYIEIGLVKNHKTHTKRIHALMRCAFFHNKINFEIDHIDNNRANNNIENLRLCTRQQNQYNRKTTQGKSSKYKGVCWHKQQNTWVSNIIINGKNNRIGTFKSEKKAAQEYDKKLKEVAGEFARTNFG